MKGLLNHSTVASYLGYIEGATLKKYPRRILLLQRESMLFRLAEWIGRIYGPSFDVQVREIENQGTSVNPFIWPRCF